VLRANYRGVGRGAETDGSIKLDFYHMARGHTAAFGEGVDESFVEVED
jgi:hypothetical protein